VNAAKEGARRIGLDAAAALRSAAHSQTPLPPAEAHTTQDTLERGFEADRLTGARWACPAGAGSNLPQSAGGSGDEQAKAKLRCIESDEVAVTFGPPA
jgi:hypothetical protein